MSTVRGWWPRVRLAWARVLHIFHKPICSPQGSRKLALPSRKGIPAFHTRLKYWTFSSARYVCKQNKKDLDIVIKCPLRFTLDFFYIDIFHYFGSFSFISLVLDPTRAAIGKINRHMLLYSQAVVLTKNPCEWCQIGIYHFWRIFHLWHISMWSFEGLKAAFCDQTSRPWSRFWRSRRCQRPEASSSWTPT